MNFELRIVKGQCAGYQKVIRQPERILIGRDATCDLTISDPLLSRQHCLIEFGTNDVKVIDLKSRNGCFVNGCKIQETVVNVGDEIKLGKHVLQILPLEGNEMEKPVVSAVTIPSTSTTACNECGRVITQEDIASMKAVKHGVYFYCDTCITKGIEPTLMARSNTIARSSIGTSEPALRSPLPINQSKKFQPTTSIPSMPKVIGNYEIIETLGEGGMGIVYKVRHTFLDTIVALKVIREELAQHSSMLKRFLQEAKLGGGLKHPNILRIQDAGEFEGIYFIAMEFFQGKDISGIVKNTGPMPCSMAIALLIQMADALGYAHEQGVIHRDVKPSNILVDIPTSTAKLADFGLAKAWHNSGAYQLTTSGQTLGTIQYISPEQLEDSRNVGPQTDIFSLGASLYFAVAGVPPFGEQPIGAVINNILHSDPSPHPNISKELEPILHRAMAKNKSDRFQSMEEFKNSLMTIQ